MAPGSIEADQPQRLVFGSAVEDFWAWRSLAELAEAQGVAAVVDVDALQDGSVSDEEADAFLTALGL